MASKDKASKKHDEATAKREAGRAKKDAWKGRSWMDNDDQAQEVLDDEAAQAKERLRKIREDNGHHRSGPELPPGVVGHRYAGPADSRVRTRFSPS